MTVDPDNPKLAEEPGLWAWLVRPDKCLLFTTSKVYLVQPPGVNEWHRLKCIFDSASKTLMLVPGPFQNVGQLYHETKVSDGTLVDGDYQRLEFAVADFNSLLTTVPTESLE
jgi:hypothetical protein